MREVYLDNAAASPVLSEVVQSMSPYFEEAYGNPQSMHSWGDATREAVEQAREQVAALIGGQADEIIFTSSGTESNNLAIKGLAQASQARGKHIVISAIEHFSVMNSVRTLQKSGFEVTHVPVDSKGFVDPDALADSLREDTILVSVMHANGEVGTIQNIGELSKLVKARGVVFHTDAVATAGTIPVDVAELGVDALSLAANPFYGPKGAAALWVRRGVRVIPQLDGGVQENGRRGGTENVPAIVGMGKAAAIALEQMTFRALRVSALRDKLIDGLLSAMDHVILTGDRKERLPNHVSFCVEFVEGESMLMMLSSQGIAVSSGSACTSKALKASHVLSAMGLPPEIAQGSLLFSLGLDTVEDDIDYVIRVMPPIVERLRQMSPLYSKFLKEKSKE